MSNIEEDLNNDFIMSIKNGDIDACNKILKKRIFTLNGYEKPLMIAAKYDQLEIYKAIEKEYKGQAIDSDHDVLPTIKNSFYIADEFESKKVIDYLKQDMLIYSAKNNDTELMKTSLKNGVDVNIKDEYGDVALICASMKGNLDVFRNLIENKADVNATDESSWTALIGASANGHNDVVKTLIENGADVNARSNTYATALMRASLNGQNEVVKTLIEHGADINAKNENGWTPLVYASRNGQNEVIKTLLIDYQAKVSDEDKKNLKDLGSTFTLELIDKRDFEKSLQREIKPIQEQTKKKSVSFKL